MTWQRKNLERVWPSSRGFGAAEIKKRLQRWVYDVISKRRVVWIPACLLKGLAMLGSSFLSWKVEWRRDGALLCGHLGAVALLWAACAGRFCPHLLDQFCSEISSPAGAGMFGRKLLTSGLKLESFFLSECPIACFRGWFVVQHGLWQLNTLSAGGSICKCLILCTLAVFPKERRHLLPWAQERVSTQTLHAVLGNVFPSSCCCTGCQWKLIFQLLSAWVWGSLEF